MDLNEAQIRSGHRGCCGGSFGPAPFCESWGCGHIATLLGLLDMEREKTVMAQEERNAAHNLILLTLVNLNPTPNGKLSEEQLALFERVRERVHARHTALAAEGEAS